MLPQGVPDAKQNGSRHFSVLGAATCGTPWALGGSSCVDYTAGSHGAYGSSIPTVEDQPTRGWAQRNRPVEVGVEGQKEATRSSEVLPCEAIGLARLQNSGLP